MAVRERGQLVAWRPDRDPAQGNPLIDLYAVETMISLSTGRRIATTETLADWYEGDDTLQAVCRAVVASLLGQVVAVPAELVA